MITPNAIELQYCYSVLNVSKEDCFNKSYDYYDQTQKVVAELNIIRSCFESFIPSIVLILVGPFIEVYGHRLLMLICTAGNKNITLKSDTYWMYVTCCTLGNTYMF